MSTRRVIAACVASCLAWVLAAAGSLGAQTTTDSLRAGARVRVVDTVSRTMQLAGTFARWLGDTVVVVGGNGATDMLRMRPWHRLDVRVAGQPHVLRNGFIGAVAGAVVGGAVGALMVDPEPHESDTCVPLGPDGSCWTLTVGGTPRYMGAAVGAGYGAVLGGLVGVITGSIRHHQWMPVTRGVQVSFAPMAGAPAMAVRVLIGRASR